MRTFTIQTDADGIEDSLIVSASNPALVSFPIEETLGANRLCSLYLWSQYNPSSTGYDALSGSANLTVKAALGNKGAVPTSGTYTLTFSGQTTAPLAWNSTAAQIQAALVALSSINGNYVVVSGGFPSFEIQFIGSLGLAAQPLITASPVLLYPASSITISTLQAGSGTQNAIQSLEINAQPVSLATSWTVINNAGNQPIGWSGSISFATAELAELFNSSNASVQPYVNTTLEFEFDNTVTGEITKYPFPIRIWQRVITPGSTTSAVTTSPVSGVFSIANGTDNGTITGLTLPGIPLGVQLQVMIPAGGLIIAAEPVYTSISSTGFSFNLSGITDSGNYKLLYTFIF